ncbi:MAG: hypothetical protein QFF03_01905 [Pseudomonadota bacterium]|nr:hypothetical protein [Pseudomonadota bacterium]
MHDFQHQRRLALASFNPVRFVDPLEVGRCEIELPAVVPVFRLKAHGWRMPGAGPAGRGAKA